MSEILNFSPLSKKLYLNWNCDWTVGILRKRVELITSLMFFKKAFVFELYLISSRLVQYPCFESLERIRFRGNTEQQNRI